jgi:hypothetical protein
MFAIAKAGLIFVVLHVLYVAFALVVAVVA